MVNRRDFIISGSSALVAGGTFAGPVKSMIGGYGGVLDSEVLPLPTAADYVQDGIVAFWDGIENVGWGTHDDTATEWQSLVSNSTIPLAAPTWTDTYLSINSDFGNAIKENSIKPIADLGAAYSLSNGFTVEYIYRRNSFNGWTGGYIFIFCMSSGSMASYTSGGYKLAVRAPYNNLWGDSRFPTAWIRNSTACVTEQTTQNSYKATTRFVAQCDGLDLTAFRDDVLLGTGSVSSNNTVRWLHVNGVLNENNWPNRYHYMHGGDVFAIRVYNKALTEEELSYNYSIDKARFKLP